MLASELVCDIWHASFGFSPPFSGSGYVPFDIYLSMKI